MYFSKIKGHSGVLSQLKERTIREEVRGVYLFQGPKGVGKHTTAQVLSRYLICNGTKDDSCRCEVCRLFPDVPDYLEIDKDTSIKVEDVDSIEKFLCLVPYKSNRRVVLINDLEGISYSAANGLLKIFEELKKYAIVIAVSSRPQIILPTLLSRTTQIDFGVLTSQEYLEVLKSKGHSSEKVNKLRSAIPYFSKSILSDYAIYLNQMKDMPGFVKNIGSMDEDDLIALVNQKDQEQSLLHFIESYVLYLNDVLKIQYDGVNALVYEDQLDSLVASKDIMSDGLCLASLEKTRKVLEQYNRGVNVNLRTRVVSALLWTYNLVQAEKVKKENESKQINS